MIRPNGFHVFFIAGVEIDEHSIGLNRSHPQYVCTHNFLSIFIAKFTRMMSVSNTQKAVEAPRCIHVKRTLLNAKRKLVKPIEQLFTTLIDFSGVYVNVKIITRLATVAARKFRHSTGHKVGETWSVRRFANKKHKLVKLYMFTIYMRFQSDDVKWNAFIFLCLWCFDGMPMKVFNFTQHTVRLKRSSCFEC